MTQKVLFFAFIMLTFISSSGCYLSGTYDIVDEGSTKDRLYISASNFRGSIELNIGFDEKDSILIESLEVKILKSDETFPPLSHVKVSSPDTIRPPYTTTYIVKRFEQFAPRLRYTKIGPNHAHYTFWYEHTDYSDSEVEEFTVSVKARLHASHDSIILSRTVTMKGDLERHFSVH